MLTSLILTIHSFIQPTDGYWTPAVSQALWCWGNIGSKQSKPKKVSCSYRVYIPALWILTGGNSQYTWQVGTLYVRNRYMQEGK